MVNLRLVPVFQSLLIQSFSKTNQSAVAVMDRLPEHRSQASQSTTAPCSPDPAGGANLIATCSAKFEAWRIKSLSVSTPASACCTRQKAGYRFRPRSCCRPCCRRRSTAFAPSDCCWEQLNDNQWSAWPTSFGDTTMSDRTVPGRQSCCCHLACNCSNWTIPLRVKDL